MKQIEILSGRCLVVELPEGAIKPHINSVGYTTFIVCHTKSAGDGYHQHNIELPKGNWRIIGMLSEVTDAELADVTGFYYNKYNERYVEMSTSAMRATPIGDIEDAIKAEGYYLDENPHGDEPKPENTPNYAYSVDVRIWESAQPRVLDCSRCLLLGREL